MSWETMENAINVKYKAVLVVQMRTPVQNALKMVVTFQKTVENARNVRCKAAWTVQGRINA